MVQRDKLDNLASRVSKERREQPDRQGVLVQWDLLELVEHLDLLVQLEPLEAKVLRVHRVFKEPRVQLDRLELEEILDHQDNLDSKVLLDLLDSKDFKATRVPQVTRARLDLKAQLEALGLREYRDHQVSQVS